MINKFSFLGLGMLAASLFVSGCGSNFDSIECVDAFNPDAIAENIEAYQMKDCQDFGNPSRNKNVYIDFSNGMVKAFTQGNNAQMLNYLTQRLTGEVKWFKLGGATISELDYPTTQLFNKVTDPKSYSTEIMAPIEETVKIITKGNEEALFITDFEEYTPDRREQFENFAKSYFTNWLKKGNTIDFYITNYVEKRKGKHLYFIVFNTPANELKELVDKAWKDRGFTYTTYTMSTNNFAFSTKYPAADKGGNYYDNKGQDIVFAVDPTHYINKSANGYEYYPCQQPWSDIFECSKALQETGTPKPFTHLLRNLFVNMRSVTAYNIEKLGVRVTDVTDDYTFFVKTREVAKNQPKMTTDPSGNKVLAEDNKTIVFECYNEDGTIKNEWVYSPRTINEFREVMELDATLFENTKKDSPEETELGIVFHKNFKNASAINNARLLRVDIVIAECTPNFGDINANFSWESITQNGKRNESLQEAVRNTLLDMNPKGKAIYTYYIQTM